MIERPNYHARYSSELSSTDFIDNSVDTTVMKPKVNGLNGITGNKWNRGGKLRDFQSNKIRQIGEKISLLFLLFPEKQDVA